MAKLSSERYKGLTLPDRTLPLLTCQNPSWISLSNTQPPCHGLNRGQCMYSGRLGIPTGCDLDHLTWSRWNKDKPQVISERQDCVPQEKLVSVGRWTLASVGPLQVDTLLLQAASRFLQLLRVRLAPLQITAPISSTLSLCRTVWYLRSSCSSSGRV